MSDLNYILTKDDSLLLVIDIQERLFPAIEEGQKEKIIRNNNILIEIGGILSIPVIVSEQYRKGLGNTVPELKEKLEAYPFYEKTYFDCMKDDAISRAVEESGKKTIILTGIETHVCVMQTALTLLQRGYRVAVLPDAVGSRRAEDREAALEALRQSGVMIYPTETVAFMLLEKAGTPEFKAAAPLFK